MGAVRGAFATPPGSQVDKQRVLLLDDVMTTGATLDACAKALREAGASSELGLTIAQAILNPQKVSREGQVEPRNGKMGCMKKEGVFPRRFAVSDAASSVVPPNDSPADSRFHNPAALRRASLVETTAKRSM